MSAMPLSDTNFKSERYFCWLRRRLPQRMYNNTPRRLRLAPLTWDSSTNKFQFTLFLKFEFHCHLNIIFDLKWYKRNIAKLVVIYGRASVMNFSTEAIASRVCGTTSIFTPLNDASMLALLV
jgi:hypothetical protein